MLRLYFIKFTCIFIAVFSFFSTQTLFANQSTIFATSIKWEDQNSRSMLLESAPKWHDDVIKSLFQAYLNPGQYSLPSPSSSQTYNVQFINAFWGPLNNPFNKNPRPAKAFLFFGQSSKNFVMAPLVKNLADGNYYVFDKSETQPMLLNDWVISMRNAHASQTLRFNICVGYGNLPTDTCISKGYRAEAHDLDNKKLLTSKTQLFSAHRDSNEDWKTKVKTTKALAPENSDSIYGGSISWNNQAARKTLLNTVVAWKNYKTIQENFEKIRDIRYFNDPEYSDFQRRISWLYPDDGCWTRATAVIRDLFGPYNNLNNDTPRPSKVFAFGNLCANTSNSPYGRVEWWYHTAPIVRDAETNITYVLDPSIDPHAPISMEKWAEAIAANTGSCAHSSSKVDIFNICTGYGTGPYSSCKTDYEEETSSMLMQSNYQSAERSRQEELGRNANDVLGDLPPWLN